MTGITIEHAQIVEWTRTRGGYPGVDRPSHDTAIPIICFSNEPGVSWDEWFWVFNDGAWAFIYEDRTPDGELSRTWRTVPRFAEAPNWSEKMENAAA